MESLADLGTQIRTAAEEILRNAIAFLPRLLSALVLLVIGWLVAKLARALVVRAARLLDRGLRKLPWFGKAGRSEPSDTSAKILGSIAHWGVFIFFLTAAIQTLAVEVISTWLTRVAQHLPSLLVGGLVIIVGVLLGGVVKDLVGAAAPVREKQQRNTLGRIGQVLVICAAVIVGAEQIGIEVTFLVILAAIVVGSFLGSLALALGLGAKASFGNLLGAHEVRRSYRVGQTVRTDQYCGIILEITNTSVVLQIEEGRVTLPASLFAQGPTVLVIDPQGVPDEHS